MHTEIAFLLDQQLRHVSPYLVTSNEIWSIYGNLPDSLLRLLQVAVFSLSRLPYASVFLDSYFSMEHRVFMVLWIKDVCDSISQVEFI